MKLLNELLNLSESTKGTTLVGLTINGELVTDKTKDEIWSDDFDCSDNPKLKSLEGAPKEVSGDFDCSTNNLTSLKGSPEKVGMKIAAGGDFVCSNNYKLKSLEGCPKEINGDFYCVNNNIKSLTGIHKHITHLTGKFFTRGTPIKSHVLGLLLIDGCKGVFLVNKEVEAILNKYLPNTRGNKAVIDCQYELSDAGLDDYAEL